MLRRNRVALVVLGLTFVSFAPAGLGVPIEGRDRILMDFGNSYTGTTDTLGRVWNSGLIAQRVGGTVTNLKNTDGTATDAGISFTRSFPSVAALGLTTSVLTDYPMFAIRDSYFISPTTPLAHCTIQGLNTALTYNLVFYGSRGPTADNRILQVTIAGVSQNYDAGGPAGEGLTTFTGISPDASGNIDVDFVCAANYGYLGVIDLVAVSGLARADTPVFSPAGGYLAEDEGVTITCNVPEAEIHYTLDGTIPTRESPLYTASIAASGQTLSARAWATGYDPSLVNKVTYQAYNSPSYIYRADNSVTVDGNLSEWQASEFVSLDDVFYGNPLLENASYAVRWDGSTNQIYVAVKVKDMNPAFADNYTTWNGQDGIEVYLHTTGGDPTDYEDTQTSAQQYVLGLKTGVSRTGDPTQNVWATFAGVVDVPREQVGFQAAGVEEKDALGNRTGWLFYEVKMTAYQYLGLTPGTSIISPLAAGQVVGVDVTAGDKYADGFGVKAENTVVNKHKDWHRIGLHKLALHPADVNGDGAVNAADIDALQAAVRAGSTDLKYDLNGDGAVNSGDVDYLVNTLLGTVYGDANLDRQCTFEDFARLQNNYGQSSGWNAGDFNGDGVVGFGDFSLLQNHYGQTGASASNGSAAAESLIAASGCGAMGLSLIAGILLIGLMSVGDRLPSPALSRAL